MGSEWTKAADRQAAAMTQEFASQAKHISITYQRREARFALKVGEATTYFSAHDYEEKKGVNWRQLRADILAQVQQRAG
jgi:hypothetical protein